MTTAAAVSSPRRSGSKREAAGIWDGMAKGGLGWQSCKHGSSREQELLVRKASLGKAEGSQGLPRIPEFSRLNPFTPSEAPNPPWKSRWPVSSAPAGNSVRSGTARSTVRAVSLPAVPAPGMALRPPRCTGRGAEGRGPAGALRPPHNQSGRGHRSLANGGLGSPQRVRPPPPRANRIHEGPAGAGRLVPNVDGNCREPPP